MVTKVATNALSLNRIETHQQGLNFHQNVSVIKHCNIMSLLHVSLNIVRATYL